MHELEIIPTSELFDLFSLLIFIARQIFYLLSLNCFQAQLIGILTGRVQTRLIHHAKRTRSSSLVLRSGSTVPLNGGRGSDPTYLR